MLAALLKIGVSSFQSAMSYRINYHAISILVGKWTCNKSYIDLKLTLSAPFNSTTSVGYGKGLDGS